MVFGSTYLKVLQRMVQGFGCYRLACVAMWTVALRPLGAQVEVRGTVWDSLAGRPLAGAVVQMVRADNPGQQLAGATDSVGTYVIAGATPGVWVLGFTHAVLDALGLDLPLARLSINEAQQVTVPLGIPGVATLARAWCRDSSEAPGLWVGRLRRATDGGVIAGGAVDVQWTTFVARGRTVEEQTPTVSAGSDDGGRFLACGLPRGELLMARGGERDTSGVLTFTLPSSGFLQRDVFVGPAGMRRMGPSGDSLLSGPGQLRGRVVGARGRPAGGARVRIEEAGVEAAANSEGYFAMDALPLGTWTMDARALGFMVESRLVDVVAGAPGEVAIILTEQEQFLDTVKVVGERAIESPSYAAFLERQARGLGHFVDEGQIERRRPQLVADLVRELPGVFVQSEPMRGNVQNIRFRSYRFGARTCAPDIFIDGAYVPNVGEGGLLESMVATTSLRAVEVYPRAAAVPPQFQRNDGCGALVLWTGERRKVQVPKPPPMG
ncbi:MAG: carboxypeptidase regulatory-like domain-containing protein [Gemmatimonadetes bacterium]|nr:carboxypeptidase regulatory-like domain-containing protein [Gemmatimonadota bacterium]